MKKIKFCVVYTYKGASTDYHKQTHQGFFESEETMVSFLEEIDMNPNKYSLKNVYITSFLRVTDKDVNRYKEIHSEIEQRKEQIKRIKIQAANAKMRRSLKQDEIDILKDAGIIV